MVNTDSLLAGFAGLTLKHLVMFAVGGVLIWLAIAKDYEPNLLLPIGFGALLANIPFSAAVAPGAWSLSARPPVAIAVSGTFSEPAGWNSSASACS